MSESGEFWACLQLRPKTGAGTDEKRPFWRALDAVANLFDLPTRGELDNALEPRSSQRLDSDVFRPEWFECVSKAISKAEITLPIWIIGAPDEDQRAREQSWEQMGLDLFELRIGDAPIFRYVPLRCLVATGLTARDRHNPPRTRAIPMSVEQARRIISAYLFLPKVQELFGHGNRDELQFCKLATARENIERFRTKIERHGGELATALLRQFDPNSIREASRERDLRRIANADCQIIRLAPLQFVAPTDELRDRYDRVVIIEDDPQMRERLASWAEDVFPKSCCITIDVEKSLDALEFRSEKNEPLFKGQFECARTLVCFDLEIGDSENTLGIPGGLWFLYHVSLKYPSASRVVITGHRSLDQKAMASGAASVALKPLGFADFQRTVEVARPFCALWLVRRSVKAEWDRWTTEAAVGKDFEAIQRRLQARLGCHGIKLMAMDETAASDECLAVADVVILDWWHCEAPERSEDEDTAGKLDDLMGVVQRIRALRPDAQILVLVPSDDRCAGPDGKLHQLGKILRDQDGIVHKPLWICGEHPTSLERRVRDAIQARPTFDVKYRVFTPLLGLIRPIAERGRTNELTNYAPLAVLVGDQQGFGVSIERLVETSDSDIIWSRELEQELTQRLKGVGAEWWRRQYCKGEIRTAEQAQEAARQLIEDFKKALKNLPKDSDDSNRPRRYIRDYLTIERWLRQVLDSGPGGEGQTEKASAEEPLTGPLRKLFGGETRYEFGARGGWYDEHGRYIRDVPLVFEFGAKRGIVGHDAIRASIVKHLCNLGGEDVVLVEEIAIAGYMDK